MISPRRQPVIRPNRAIAAMSGGKASTSAASGAYEMTAAQGSVTVIVYVPPVPT